MSPPDVVMTAVQLNVRQYDPAHDDPIEVEGLRTVYNKPQASINVSPRIHIDPTAPDAADEGLILQCRSDSASVDILFRSPAWGVLGAATVASLVLTVLLWVASTHLASLDRQTFAAALLVFPAIVTVYLLRPGEHAFSRRLLTGVRVLGLVVATCSLAVATLLGAGSLTVVKPGITDLPHGTQRLACERSLFGPVDCTLEPAMEPERVVNASTQAWIGLLAGVATALTLVLALGTAYSWLWAGRRYQGKTEEHTPFPSPGD